MEPEKSMAEQKLEDMTRVIDAVNSLIVNEKMMARISIDTKIWQLVDVKANVRSAGQMQQSVMNIPMLAIIDMQHVTSEPIEIIGKTMICIHEPVHGWLIHVPIDAIKIITAFNNEPHEVNASKFEHI